MRVGDRTLAPVIVGVEGVSGQAAYVCQHTLERFQYVASVTAHTVSCERAPASLAVCGAADLRRTA